MATNQKLFPLRVREHVIRFKLLASGELQSLNLTENLQVFSASELGRAWSHWTAQLPGPVRSRYRKLTCLEDMARDEDCRRRNGGLRVLSTV